MSTSQATRSALDNNESQAAQSALDNNESQAAQSAVDKSQSSRPLCLAISTGEPAGIGPELLVHAIMRGVDAKLVYIGDTRVLEEASRVLRAGFYFERFDALDHSPIKPQTIYYVPQKLAQENEFGFLRRGNAPYVLNALSRAAAGCISGEFDAMVTGPIHKGNINDAGIPFSGHTEFLQKLAGDVPVVMMLATDIRLPRAALLETLKLRVALATTHLPLSQVPAAISKPHLLQTIRTLHTSLRTQFGIEAPRIGVLGLNPHAGEGGHLGREEIDIIEPVLQQLRAEGLNLLGPWPADTAFVPEKLRQVDAVLAMYHDQGLPVLKTLGFGEAVNITLGLPFIRTSVDHGTALELAGKALANPNSFYAAIDAAVEMVKARRGVIPASHKNLLRPIF
jgi:4-hydroxythreonine-4-phosphate dehydrogenase